MIDFCFNEHVDQSLSANEIISYLLLARNGKRRDLRDMRRMRDLIAFGAFGKGLLV
jgi:hypothetical protein